MPKSDSISIPGSSISSGYPVFSLTIDIIAAVTSSAETAEVAAGLVAGAETIAGVGLETGGIVGTETGESGSGAGIGAEIIGAGSGTITGADF